MKVHTRNCVGDITSRRHLQEAIEAAVKEARSEAYKEGYAAGQQDKDSKDTTTE